MRKTVLIIGISSFVGSNLAEFLKKDYKVVGTYFQNPIEIPDVLSVQCDVLNRDAVQMIIYTFRPDFTIYCAGLTNMEDCAKQDKYGNTLNTIGAFNVSSFTERYKSRLCYVSTAFIFSGINKYFNENDTPDPNTQYGKTKASAEFFIQKSCLNYLLFRSCQLYGRSINFQEQNIFEYLQKKMSRGETVTCDGNIHVGFLDVYYLAIMIKMAIEKDASNRLFQIASSDYMTYYDFAKLFAKIFQYDENLVAKGRWFFSEIRPDSSDIEGYNRYFKISNSNVENFFQIKMPTIQESLEFTFMRMGGEQVTRRKSDISTGSIKYI